MKLNYTPLQHAVEPVEEGREARPKALGLPVTVLNKGINGEEANQMVARFAADVLDEAPDLVLWQLGSNSVLRDHPTPAALIHQGIEELKKNGADAAYVPDSDSAAPAQSAPPVEKPEGI